MLEVRGLTCRIGGRTIVEDISLSFEPGRLHVIVGPNGSGKSTFLKTFSGDLALSSGDVTYDGRPLAGLPEEDLARYRAVMTQLPELSFPLSVNEIVMMGRYPHFSFRPSARDVSIVEEVKRLLSIEALGDRDYLTLSGGERQRVQFGRALAQIWDAPPSGSRYLFLDEPVSSLDVHYQHQFLQLVRSMVKEGVVIVAVLHDLNLALQYADLLVFMKQGRVVAQGGADIVTPSVIKEVFDVEARLVDDPAGDRPVIVFARPSMS
ncbi:MAG: heme ABC transporter ATP-binding protein [Bacteroidetes bacterium]|nr:heme ABC transporter ATP-binding protein [Bacteroidota bacterium]